MHPIRVIELHPDPLHIDVDRRFVVGQLNPHPYPELTLVQYVSMLE